MKPLAPASQAELRATLESDDGAIIFVQYHGRCDISQGIEAPGPIYSTPRLETGDPRDLWLNKVQAVQKGKVDFAKGEIVDQMYEVRWVGHPHSPRSSGRHSPPGALAPLVTGEHVLSGM